MPAARRTGQPYIVTSVSHAVRLFPHAPQLCAAVAEMLSGCDCSVVVWVQSGRKGGVRYAIDRPENATDEEIAALGWSYSEAENKFTATRDGLMLTAWESVPGEWVYMASNYGFSVAYGGPFADAATAMGLCEAEVRVWRAKQALGRVCELALMQPAKEAAAV